MYTFDLTVFLFYSGVAIPKHGTDIVKNIDSFPRTIPRLCGGWLAVSNAKSDLKIGVAAETEEAAKQKYKVAVAAWRNLLAEPDACEASAD